jgi:hypothetical protein
LPKRVNPLFLQALDGGRIVEALMQAVTFPKNTGQLSFIIGSSPMARLRPIRGPLLRSGPRHNFVEGKRR